MKSGQVLNPPATNPSPFGLLKGSVMSEQEKNDIMKIAVNMMIVFSFALGLLAGALIEHYKPELLAWLTG